jgi:L-fuconolactonase
MPPAPDYVIYTSIHILADAPNVYFKFTEINVERMQEANVDPALVVRQMADRFGAGRLMWGSDVGQSVKWSYAAKVEHARAAARLLRPAEREDFLHATAARIYQ